MILDMKEVSANPSGYLRVKERAVQSFWDGTVFEEQQADCLVLLGVNVGRVGEVGPARLLGTEHRTFEAVRKTFFALSEVGF